MEKSINSTDFAIIIHQIYVVKALVKSGLTVDEAIKQSGTSLKQRAVYYLVERYEKYGKAGLTDKRWRRKTEIKVLTSEVIELILAWFFERRAAGYRAIAELTAETCRERNLPIPSENTVKKFLIKQSEGVKLARKGALQRGSVLVK